jgi:hypothetical protein
MHLSIGVTGHRDLIDSERQQLAEHLQLFLGDLARQFPGLDLQILSGLADGADRLVAATALQLGIEVVAVLPMPRQEYEHDFESASSLAEFRRLLSACRQVIELPVIDDSPVAVPANRDRQYGQLGMFISNHCQVLLALWDGKDSRAVGGTSQVVRYHLSGVMRAFDEDQSADLLANNENDLVYHLVCSRQRENGGPEDTLEAGTGHWINSLRGRETGPGMPAEYRLMLDRLQQFDADEEKYREAIRSAGSGLLDDPPELPLPAGAEQADRLYRSADWLAVHFQKRFDRSLRAVYGLAAAMGLVFLIYSEYSGPSWMVLLFLALFFSGVVLNRFGARRQWHRKYLDYRALAEGLRVQIYWNLAGVVNPASAGFAYGSFLGKQDMELGWIRHVMRAASMQRPRGSRPDEGWVEWVIGRWVGDEGRSEGQLAYYSRKSLENALRQRRTQLLGNISLWAGIAVAVLLLLLGKAASSAQVSLMMVLMGVLPLIAGVRDAYSHKKAQKELIRQYDFMGRIFGNARQLLNDADGVRLQRRVLRALGEAALEEGANWILMHRERPLEYSGL